MPSVPVVPALSDPAFRILHISQGKPFVLVAWESHEPASPPAISVTLAETHDSQSKPFMLVVWASHDHALCRPVLFAPKPLLCAGHEKSVVTAAQRNIDQTPNGPLNSNGTIISRTGAALIGARFVALSNPSLPERRLVIQ